MIPVTARYSDVEELAIKLQIRHKERHWNKLTTSRYAPIYSRMLNKYFIFIKYILR